MRPIFKAGAIALFGVLGLSFLFAPRNVRFPQTTVLAQTTTTPAAFDQAAAIAKLKEQIKGKEKEPASAVFKNIQLAAMKNRPAAQLLAVMEFGFARSLGVTCTHCHVTDKWEAEDKAQKQVARDMSLMAAQINTELLKGIKNLKSESPTINCTTCHRGEVKPALNLPAPRP
jgi:hypothetical protein